MLDPKDFVKKARDAGVFTLDIETIAPWGQKKTASLDPHTGKIQGIAVEVDGETAYWAFGQDGEHSFQRTMKQLRPLLSDPEISMIGHNLSFDTKWLRQHGGYRVRNKLIDTMVASWLVNEDRSPRKGFRGKYGLKKLVFEHFGHKMDTFGETGGLFGPPVGEYAQEDVRWTRALWDHYEQDLIDDEVIDVFHKIEMPLVHCLAEMELTGMRFDPQLGRVHRNNVLESMGKLERRLTEQMGHIKLGSDKDVARILYDEGWLPRDPDSDEVMEEAARCRIPTDDIANDREIPRGASGELSTKKDVLALFKHEFPLIKDMLEYRHHGVAMNTFIDKLIYMANTNPTGRIHGGFNQTGTKIGRLSCVSGSTILSVRVGNDQYRRSIRISELGLFSGRQVSIVTHRGRERRILHLANKGPGFMFDVETEDGCKIRCTKDHRFLTERGWRALKDLRVGDRVIRAEVRETQEVRRDTRTKVGARQALVPSDLRGGRAGGSVEDPGLRALERDCVDLQGDLRLGVPAPVSGHTGEARGPGRGPALLPDVGSARGDQGVSALEGVVRGDLRRQQPVVVGGPTGVWRVSPGDGASGSGLRGGVLRPAIGQEGSAYQRGKAQAGDLLPEGGARRSPGRRSLVQSDCSASGGRRIRGQRGSAPPRDREEHGGIAVLADGPFGRGNEGPRGSQSGDQCPAGGRAGVLRGPCRDLPAGDLTLHEVEACRVGPSVRCGAGKCREEAPDVLHQQGRNEAVACSDRSRHSAQASPGVLQELAGGLRLAGGEAVGRGGRGLAPEGRGHQGQGQAQGEEGQGAWLPGAQVHDGGRVQAAAYRGEGDRGGSGARIARIAPAQVEDVWDIEVEEDHSYEAHGFVSHNSARPNMQNMPRPDDYDNLHDSIRGCFVEDEGFSIVDRDLSQIELRMMAHWSEDPIMLGVYKSGGVCPSACETFVKKGKCQHVDIHQATADAIGIQRQIAKNINFGACYRIGPKRLRTYADVPTTGEARTFLQGWYDTYDGVVDFHQWVERELKRNAWKVRSITGRLRRLMKESKINDYRAITQGIQFIISGSSQDLLKIGMRNFHQGILERAESDPRWDEVRMTCQVHDQVTARAPDPIAHDVYDFLGECMETADSGALSVPITSDGGVAKRWVDAH